jgi:glutamate-1-semialdehyde 2,1-aminomutase
VPTIAAIATIERLAENGGEVYRHLEALGQRMQQGIEGILAKSEVTGVVARQGSAFCTYFMDHLPTDWHDLIEHHDTDTDARLRRRLLDSGVYFFQLPMKQCSISAAHTEADIDLTLHAVEEAFSSILCKQ